MATWRTGTCGFPACDVLINTLNQPNCEALSGLPSWTKRSHLRENKATTSWQVHTCSHPLGLYLDRLGRKPVGIIGYVFYITIGLATSFSPNYMVFLVLRFVAAIAVTWRGIGGGIAGTYYCHWCLVIVSWPNLKHVGTCWLFNVLSCQLQAQTNSCSRFVHCGSVFLSASEDCSVWKTLHVQHKFLVCSVGIGRRFVAHNVVPDRAHRVVPRDIRHVPGGVLRATLEIPARVHHSAGRAGPDHICPVRTKLPEFVFAFLKRLSSKSYFSYTVP